MHFLQHVCSFVSGPTASQWARASSFARFLDNTQTHHTRWDPSGRVISPSHRPLPENKQHSQQTNIHALSGIRTHNLSRRAAADLRLRPRGHSDRHFSKYLPAMSYWVIVQQISPKLPSLQGYINPTYQLALATKFDTLSPNITVSSECNLLMSPPPPHSLLAPRDFEMATRLKKKLCTPALLQVCAA